MESLVILPLLSSDCFGQKSACLTDRSRLATVWQSSENAALSAALMDVRELCGNFGQHEPYYTIEVKTTPREQAYILDLLGADVNTLFTMYPCTNSAPRTEVRKEGSLLSAWSNVLATSSGGCGLRASSVLKGRRREGARWVPSGMAVQR